MKKLLTLLCLFSIVFCLANIDSVEAARKKKTEASGLTQEQITSINSNIENLTKKIYSASLFSPQENAQIMQIKMQLDDQMLVSPDTAYAPLYYKLGNLFKARDYKNEAIDCYQTVLENFSDTAMAPKAVKELKALGVVIKDPAAEEETVSDSEDESGW